MPTITFQPQLREVRDILGSDFYVIPRFQRPYSWTSENLEDFLQDVIGDNDEGYFIGPMVAYKVGKRVAAIVDGQQRVTTISILMCVLRDLFLEIGEHKLATAITRYIERDDDDSVDHFVLRAEAAGEFLKSQIQVKPPRTEVRPGNDEQRALRKAYDEISSSLRERIAGLDTERSADEESPATKELRLVRDRVLSLQTIWIQLDSEDDAYIIFETLNSRGKDLEVVDLLKNHLLSKLKPENGDLDSARLGWTKMRETLFEAGNANPNKFILHWWLSKGDYTAERKLYKLLKKRLDQKRGRQTIAELQRDSATYARIASPGTVKWKHHEGELRDALAGIDLFGVRQPRPFLLAAMRSYRDGTIKYATCRKVVSSVESFHYVTTAIVGVSSTGGISQMYAKYARDLTAASDSASAALVCDQLVKKLRGNLSTRDVFLPEFERQLKFSEDEPNAKRLVQYTLRRLHAKSNPSHPLDLEKCNIEHLHPQSSADSWAGNIGNLFLLSADLNSKLGHSPFAAKKAVLAEQSGNYDLQDVLSADTWDERHVHERAQRLAKYAYDSVWTV